MARSGVVLGAQRAVVVLVALALVLVWMPAEASATEVRVHGTERVLGELRTQRLEIRMRNGDVARGNVLRFPADAPELTLRPRLARGTAVGTERFTTMASRERGRGAVAGVNGGYFLPRPWGVPNGLFVDDGILRAGQAVTSVSQGGLPTGRGMVGWRHDGPLVMDRLLVTLTLEREAAARPPLRFDEINRQVFPPDERRRHRPNGELLLFDHRFGASVTAPAGSVVVTVDGLRVRSSGATSGTVGAVRTLSSATNVGVPDGRHLIVAYGARAEALRPISVGEPVAVRTTLAPEATPGAAWERLDAGIAGGQQLLRAGQIRPAAEWGRFAAFGTAHVGRNPRTAIGWTRSGEVLLVTIDGRRRGWSVGASMRELAEVMQAIGAVDAVNLDGGGSTTLTIDGAVRNRPSEAGRSVADGLFIYVTDPPSTRGIDLACPPELLAASPRFIDVRGTIHERAVGCLAGWRVTSGVSETRFAPDAPVTRAQMASFLARWMDDLAERGDGRALPETTDHPFTDVTAGNAHRREIARLAAAGVISGRSSTSFEPTSPVTRAQTATMVAGAIAYAMGAPLPPGRDSFVDDNRSPHEDSIDRLASAGIVSGVGGFSYQPDRAVTRGAMASVLMRASDWLVELGSIRPPPPGAVVASTALDDPADGAAADGDPGDDAAPTVPEAPAGPDTPVGDADDEPGADGPAGTGPDDGGPDPADGGPPTGPDGG